ncbi:Cdc37 Hsp90 binding domain protein, partial [Ancylostoma ceylanicum]
QLEQKLKSTDISAEEKTKIEKEIEEIKDQEAKWLAKEKELEEQERLEPWNVDTIGHEGFSYSRVNKITEKKPPPKLSDEEDSKRMTSFFDKNEGLIQEYGKLKTLEESEAFILEHPHLASEYTANYLTIDALNMAIDHKEEEMSNIARQCIVIQYLLELAKNMNAIPTNASIIKAFFKKFRAADPQYLKLYTDEVAAFEDRLRRRAKEKRDAALAEYEAEEKEKRIAAAPGGLDPQEVYESLPEEMRAAFDSQDVSKLQEVAMSMDREVFSYHFQRCIDSGLWVPNASSEEAEQQEHGEEEKRIAAAPGGLDPQEVYESLPEEMRAAFDSQDVSKLQEVAMSMDREVFSYHFQRCIDSGLWVPNASSEEAEQQEHGEEGATAEPQS